MSEDNKIVELPLSENEVAVSEIVETDKMKALSEKINETDKQLQELKSDESKLLSEDMIVQENEWLKSRIEEERLTETRIREELFEKQKLLENRRKEQSEDITQLRQMQLFNKLHEDEQRDMVYAVHGISVDKEEGMREYKNALYQGAQITLFIVGLVLCASTAVIYGLSSGILLSIVALLASQTALLPREENGKILNGLFGKILRVLSFVPVIMMASLIICKELNLFPIENLIFVAGVTAVTLSLIGSIAYYLRNPYRRIRRAAKEAKSDIKVLKRSAAKTVKKNQKLRAKLEAKLKHDKDKQDNRLNRLKEKEEMKFARRKRLEEARAEKLKLKLEKEAERREKNVEINAIREENKKKRKELASQKIVDFKNRFISNDNKKVN